jgi:hypothetical protein
MLFYECVKPILITNRQFICVLQSITIEWYPPVLIFQCHKTLIMSFLSNSVDVRPPNCNLYFLSCLAGFKHSNPRTNNYRVFREGNVRFFNLSHNSMQEIDSDRMPFLRFREEVLLRICSFEYPHVQLKLRTDRTWKRSFTCFNCIFCFDWRVWYSVFPFKVHSAE